jgi:hypothetical protein
MKSVEQSDDKNTVKKLKPLLPKITNDEVDLEVDDRRDEEIKNDRPPHHN